MKFKRIISISTSIVLLTSSLYSDSWSSTQNEHGFIFKSNNTTLYLGKSCDARLRGQTPNKEQNLIKTYFNYL